MGLLDSVALKFSAYSLACHHFTAHLPDLDTATRDDTRLSCKQCCDLFDRVLRNFFELASLADVPEAASLLGGLLKSQADLFRRKSPISAAVFDRVVATMTADASNWNYAADVQTMHNLGRDLARHFYANSPYAITQERCCHECPLEFEYGMPDEGDDWPIVSALSFNYRAAPVAFHPNSGTIVVRFNFDNDLALYMAYPFLFLHEYTAHIYATDYGNDLFNDGWMLHAADAFMRRCWNADDPMVAGMSRQQVTIFDHFSRVIEERNPIVGRAHRFARDFEAWLTDCAPGQFDAMTYDLAAFGPSPTRWKGWPNVFLISLEEEFNRNRVVLLDRIKSVVNLVPTASVQRVGVALEKKVIRTPTNVSRGELRRIIDTYLSESELRNFCFDQDVDYENLPGQTKGDKVRGLIEYFERHRSHGELVEAIYQLRLNAPWPV